MSRNALAWVACLLLTGCGNRLNQGDRVTLIDPAADKVPVRSPDTAAFDMVPAGTKASVVLDDPKEIGEDRPVRVKLLDPPYQGLTGRVRRKNLKAD